MVNVTEANMKRAIQKASPRRFRRGWSFRFATLLAQATRVIEDGMPGENRPRTWEVPGVPLKTEVGITERKTGMLMALGKSDRSIVLGGRESRPLEGEEKMQRGRDRHQAASFTGNMPRTRGGQSMPTSLKEIAKQAKEDPK